jgi:hypothetical protein
MTIISLFILCALAWLALVNFWPVRINRNSAKGDAMKY